MSECPEQWDTRPYTSDHLWTAGLHGEAVGNCRHCRKPVSEWNAQLKQKVDEFLMVLPPPTLAQRAEQLLKELRLGIMATPGIITVRDEWRLKLLTTFATEVRAAALAEQEQEVIKIAARFKLSTEWWESWAEEHSDNDGLCNECGVLYNECVYQAAYEMVNALTALRHRAQEQERE